MPDVFVGDPDDVKAAWTLLEEAAAYGPRTRGNIEILLKAIKIVQGYGGSGMKIPVVRNDPYIQAVSDKGVFDIGDLEKFPSGSSSPLPPANVMLHEFTEQWFKQIAGYERDAAHRIAIDAENMANSERYPSNAPVRPYTGDVTIVDQKLGMSIGAAIPYNAPESDLGGRSHGWVTFSGSFYLPFTVSIEWK